MSDVNLFVFAARDGLLSHSQSLLYRGGRHACIHLHRVLLPWDVPKKERTGGSVLFDMDYGVALEQIRTFPFFPIRAKN